MPYKDHATNPEQEKPDGEGWLVSPEQQKVVQFKHDLATAHVQWVAVRTYSWVPPRPPVPQTRRRMLRHNAIEAWETVLPLNLLQQPLVVDRISLESTITNSNASGQG